MTRLEPAVGSLEAAGLIGALLLSACGGGGAPATTPHPVPEHLRPVQAQAGSPLPDSLRSVPPAVAFQRHLIALYSTGVDRFAAQHPEWDGRGVLIAILDTGIDPGIPGLQQTADDATKIVDLRDFSGEGRIRLAPVSRNGDTLRVAGRAVAGASRVAAVSTTGAFFGGVLPELRLGKAPAADLDGNGIVGDSLPVVVTRTASGWALFADTQGDGTLRNDRPIHDFSIAHEAFGWSRTARPPGTYAVANFADSAGTPTLDLLFDTFGHGSHVAGIAAGHDLYGVAGFDGVAPGARLLGLKIANDAAGGVSVTGSMVRAAEYAIATARARRLPLVINLSFGVGNGIEGTARIDALLDSVLASHPEVVAVVAAGNDGPGLSTLGFPGSASRVLSVGATQPLVFAGLPATGDPPEPVAPFSSRGGELAGPDIVAPGIAYSTVPNFAVGGEQESGTSMATPYVSGMVARLLSAARASGFAPEAAQLRQALRIGTRMPPAAGAVDAGFGMPDISQAWAWLSRRMAVPQVVASIDGRKARAGILLTADADTPWSASQALGARVTLRRLDSQAPTILHLRAGAPWLQVPEVVSLVDGQAEFSVRIGGGAFMTPGVVTAAIQVESDDATIGPLLLIPVTVRRPLPTRARVTSQTVAASTGGIARVFVAADSGIGFQIEVAALQSADHVLASLGEPGGMPFRDLPSMPAGAGDAAGLFDLSADNVVGGLYEVDVSGGGLAPVAAKVTVTKAPVRLGATLQRDTLRVRATNTTGTPVPLRLRAGLVGAARSYSLTGSGPDARRIAIPVPAWASRVRIDTRMPAEEWSQFTDFGLSLEDRAGRLLETGTLNYPLSRTTLDVSKELAGDSLVLRLAPAFANAVGPWRWAIELDVHYYADRITALDNGGTPFRPLGNGASREERFAFRNPFSLPAGFVPLITVVALEGESHVWSREIALITGKAGEP